ncbi:transposable element gene, partial [Prunus dulcis]
AESTKPTEFGELPTQNPIASHVSSDRLSPSYDAFVHQMVYVVIVSKVEEALHPKVTQAMNEEIEAHKKNYTWVFTIKHKDDGIIERYKGFNMINLINIEKLNGTNFKT